MPLKKPIEHLSESDIASALFSGGQNPLNIELKPELPRRTSSSKLEWLSDVASFANASGGHILFGVKNESGALELAGLDRQDITAVLNWLPQTAWSGIAPRIPGLQIREITLKNSKSILVVRVPRTATGPHMVVFHEANKFYSRGSWGRYALQVDELRSAFAHGQSLHEQARLFRMERINTLLHRPLTIKLSDGPKVALHIMPAAAFQPGHRINLERVTAGDGQLLQPMAARGIVSQFNYDGVMAFSATERHASTHVQVFRNGCLEAVDSSLLEPNDGRKFIPSAVFEKEVIECGGRLFNLLRELEISPPWVVALSLLGVRGYNMFVGAIRWQAGAHSIEREHLYLDEVIIEDVSADFSRAMRPVFDQLWNSCGWARSLNYDADGHWHEHTG